jgi:lipoprotein-anchoring transpeptidase ErfK/SrfK
MNKTVTRSTGLISIAVACGLALFGASTGNASASNQIVAYVSLHTQTMEVMVDGRPAFEWKVSTGRKGFETPTGAFKPTRMHEMWYSTKYDDAPMPHAVFFSGGYAVHATDAIKRLGHPASHGCVRLRPDDAADFFTLVNTFGPSNTSIVIAE